MEKVRTDKRLRLIEAANALISQHGFNQTTLADIARKSEVPLGNVYYYFKTKDELGSALIEHRADSYHDLIDAWNQLPDLALYLVSVLQGASLQTHAFKKPDLIAREAELLKEWVNAL
jgi:AcrR family transcriptional regulator